MRRGLVEKYLTLDNEQETYVITEVIYWGEPVNDIAKTKQTTYSGTHDSSFPTLVELQLARHDSVQSWLQLGQTRRHSRPSEPQGG
jgi:hypothetical protein